MTFNISRHGKKVGFFGIISTKKVSSKILETPTVGVMLQSQISGYFTTDPFLSTVAQISQPWGCQLFWSRIGVTEISRVKKVGPTKSVFNTGANSDLTISIPFLCPFLNRI